MTFDVRKDDDDRHPIQDNYNSRALRHLQEWTNKRSDVDTLVLDKPDIVETTDMEIHEEGDIIDYIEEEYQDTVGYFKDWDQNK